MKKIEIIIRILIAIIIGELILVLGTTLAQEVIFDGIGWNTSSYTELLIGGFGSFLAAVLSGAVAYLIVKQANQIPIIVLSILVFMETSWLIQSGRFEEPIWFSVVAGGTLIVGFWVGKLILSRFLLAFKK